MLTTLQKESKENVGMEEKKRIAAARMSHGSKDHGKKREALSDLDNEKLSGVNERASLSKDHDTMMERLRVQREKAIEFLEKYSNSERPSLASFKHLPSLERSSKTSPANSPKPAGLNQTDYVLNNKNIEFNISELVADHTIDIKSMSGSRTSTKVSFEPSEITGRSTMCQQGKISGTERYPKTVQDILSQSVVDDVRSLSDTLSSCGALTRTVDNIPDSNSSGCSRPSFAACVRDDDSELFGESFKPAEMMGTQLCADERAWEQQYADIPNFNRRPTDENPQRFTAAMRLDNNFSIGDYFSKHSESIRNIVSDMTSPKKRPPIALHEVSMESSDQSMSSQRKSGMDMRTPRVDGKRYSEYVRPNAPQYKNRAMEIESGKSSSRMDMMAIQRALAEINPEDSFDLRGKFSMAMKDMKKNIFVDDLHTAGKKSFTSRSARRDHSSPTKDEPEHPSLEDTLGVSKSYLEMSCKSGSSFGSPVKDKRSKTNPNLLQTPSKLKSRKRSHSSSRLDNGALSDQEVPIRRSRSPTTHSELAAAAASRPNASGHSTSASHSQPNLSSRSKEYSMTESDRQFLIDSKSPDCGKYSLPGYGAITRSISTLSNMPSKLRSNSQCSSSSEFSHRGGKLPLKASILEVFWGCVRLRRSIQKAIHIKNTSNKRLVLKVEVSGPGFQLVHTCEDSPNIIILQSLECRTLNLNFCPTVIGAAAGQLVFSSPYGQVSGEAGEVIKLFGHGGHCNIIPRGILKGPIGSAYLPMGELKQLTNPLKTTFTLFNKGPLTGFACVLVETMGLEIPRLCNCIEVTPNKVLINPESSATITVKFSPRREDIKKIFRKLVNKNMDVITLVNLKLIMTENATRRRIQGLIQQMNVNEKLNFEGTLSLVWDPLPNEEPLQPMEMFKERVATTFHLISKLRTDEIAVTLSHSILENTIQDTLLFSENDETILFRTIVSDASFCNSTNEDSDALEMQRNSVESWSVRPSRIEIDLADKSIEKATFTIHSNFILKKQYHIDTNVRHVMQFEPMKGFLMPGEVVEVKVQMKFGFLPSEAIQIWVFLDDLKITLPVIVKNGNFPAQIG